jgi:glutathione-independent formaldehyde dehydrogenase
MFPTRASKNPRTSWSALPPLTFAAPTCTYTRDGLICRQQRSRPREHGRSNEVGDGVVLPFNIGRGFCANCERDLSAFCLTTANRTVIPNMAGAAYGFTDMGPYRGGQAQFLRVPMGTTTAWYCPNMPKKRSAIMSCCPTYSPRTGTALVWLNLEPGDSVVIYGSGPVGLMAGHSAGFQGAVKFLS